MVSLVVRGAERLRLSRDSRIAHRARRRVVRACTRVWPRPHAIAARIARMKDLQRAV
ncbi:hypothetical protein QZM91_25015 [Burkholderia multivorans]|nr:hypothetical protein [Burkholderia multivorans]